MERNYEFNEQENVIIKKLYKNMNFVGYSFLVLGAIFTAIGISWISHKDLLWILAAFVGAVVFITIGVITNNTASRFKAVVKTEGDDVEHLMTAIDNLISWFSIQIVFIGIGVAVVILAFFASISQ